MDGKLVGEPPPTTKGGDQERLSPVHSYKDTFEEMFPYYLSIGMTEEQYWDKDSDLVTFYRKADEMRVERKNMEMWLQGRYVYDAICSVAPVLQAFAKKGTKPIPYVDEPYPITKQSAEDKERRKELESYNKNKAFMEAFMITNNQAFEKKEG